MTEKTEIEHLKCASCNKQITQFKDDIEDADDGIITADTHFDISRSKKEFEINDGNVEEIMKERNEKMLYTLCEECFLLVLNESKTLGNLFWIKSKNIKNMFIY